VTQAPEIRGPDFGATRRFDVGSTRGRLPGGGTRLEKLFVCDDGRHARFFDPGLGLDPFYGFDLASGEVSALTDPRLPRASALSSNGRVTVTVVSPHVIWRDVETGETETVTVSGVRAAQGASHDGRYAWIERARVGPPGQSTPLVLLRRGAPEPVFALDAEPIGFTSDGRFAVARTVRAIVRVSLVDGAAVMLPAELGFDFRWGACVERGGARVVVATSETMLSVVDLDTGQVETRAMPAAGLHLRECACGVVLLSQSAFAAQGLALRTATFAYDLDTLTLRRRLDGPAVLSPDGRWALVVSSPALVRVDLDTGRTHRWHDGAEGAIRALVWSHDSRQLAIVGDGVRVVDASDGRVAWEFECGAVAWSARFSPDGRTLLTLTASSLLAWSLATGEEVSRSTVESSTLHRLDLSPDGRYAMVWSFRGDAEVYDLSAARRVARLGGGRALERAWFSDVGVATAIAKSGLTRGVHVRWRSPDGQVLETGAVRLSKPANVVIDTRGERLVELVDGTLTTHPLRGGGSDRLATGLDTLRLAKASPTGFVAFSAGLDGVFVLDGATARVRAKVKLPRPCHVSSLSPDASALAMAYSDGRVEVFSIAP
jgi:outer membrane protein assembly factor BamB